MSIKRINPIQVRHQRLRKKVAGNLLRPRLSVHFSGRHIYAQVIDDDSGLTIASAATTEVSFVADPTTRANTSTAKKVGKLVAERAKLKSISMVVFDRGGFIYHGKVKALADAARQVGLDF